MADTAHSEVVAILVQPALLTGVGFCTGFLVAPNLVMTARHCVSSMSQNALICADEVLQGTTYTATRALSPEVASHFSVTQTADLNSMAPVWRAVRAVHVPSDVAGKPNCGNDVALLELTAPLAGVTPLSLRAALPSTSETYSAIGYGLNGAVIDSDGTRRMRSGLGVSSVGLRRGLSTRIEATEQDWVADLGPCGGDSGSPALDSQGRVIGVMSRGNPTGCTLMIYTEVTPFREWVKQIARDAAGRAGIPVVDWVAAESLADAGPEDAGPMDSGTPDAGLLSADAGAGDAGSGNDGGSVADAGVPDLREQLNPDRRGAGCSAAGGSLSLLAVGAVLRLRRRRVL